MVRPMIIENHSPGNFVQADCFLTSRVLGLSAKVKPCLAMARFDRRAKLMICWSTKYCHCQIVIHSSLDFDPTAENMFKVVCPSSEFGLTATATASLLCGQCWKLLML